jgi:hypothetical protein
LTEPSIRRGPFSFRKAVLGINVGEVLVDHHLDADNGAAFLAGLRQQNDVTIERRAGSLQQKHRHQACGQIVLVIQGPASVHVATLTDGTERWMAPFGSIDRDDVSVSHHEERPLSAAPLQPCDQVRPIRIDSADVERNALAF